MIHTKVRCREIRESDVEAIAGLLTRGFVGRTRRYWMEGLRRQALRAVPENYPRFGYMLEDDGTAVGVLLLIYGTRLEGDEEIIQCNLSSWYVEPAYRNYAPLLTKIAQRHKNVTYLNISPAVWTWPLIEMQGFRAYCEGLFVSLPALSRKALRSKVEITPSDVDGIEGLGADESELLARHAGYGCLSLVIRSADGVIPFIFQAVRIRRGRLAPPAMRLIYCRDITDYAACAGVIGRLLLRLGMVLVIVDTNGPIPGLIGFHTKRGRKYFKGPHQPRLGDLTDTELVLFGP